MAVLMQIEKLEHLPYFIDKWLFLLVWQQQNCSLRRFSKRSSPNCHVFQIAVVNGHLLFFWRGDQEVKIIIFTYNLF